MELGAWDWELLTSYPFGEATGVVTGATETAADGAGLVAAGAEPVTLADGATDDAGAGLTVAVPVATAGLGETETPGTGVAVAAGMGVCPAVTLLLRSLEVLAFRA